jgi:WD40 repeat protein
MADPAPSNPCEPTSSNAEGDTFDDSPGLVESHPTVVSSLGCDFLSSGALGDEVTRMGPAPVRVVAMVPPEVPGYAILEEIGRGGMGVVYLARHQLLNRSCALKMILAGAHADAESSVRFLAEAEAVARIQHANIVQIRNIGDVRGLPFFELEYISGGSLDQRMDGTPWSPQRGACMVSSLARGAAEAHRQGIVHRDLKPANILLAADGTPKIADFGLAKMLYAETGLTQTESILGSPSYMAPEQAEGRTRDIGPAADTYALGAILYALLTGRPPFKGATPLQTLELVRTTEPVPPRRLVPDIPRDLETICLKCLEKDPARRYESSAALADDIDRFQHDEPILARRIGPAERAARWCRRNPLLAILGTLLAVLAIAGPFVAVNQASLAARARRAVEVEKQARRAAHAAERRIRQHLYVADINRAYRAWNDGDVELAAELLARQRLREGEPEHRGPEWFYLDGLCRRARAASPLRESQGIEALAVAPDGSKVAVLGNQGTLDVWDGRLERRERTLTWSERTPSPYFAGLDRAAFSTDGKRLGTAYISGEVLIWDLTTQRGPEVHEIRPTEGVDARVALTPDLSAAALVQGRSVATLDLATGKEERFEVPGVAEAPVRAAAFSADGGLLAWSCGNTTFVWDVRKRTLRHELGGEGHWSYAVAISPDGTLLARHTGGQPHFIELWDLADGQCLAELSGHRRRVCALAFAPDGKLLASADDEGHVLLWDVATKGLRATFKGPAAEVACLAFGPNGRWLMAGSIDGLARRWPLETVPESLAFKPDPNFEPVRMAVSRDGRRLAVIATSKRWGLGARESLLWLWDPKTGHELARHKVPGTIDAITSDGRTMAVAVPAPGGRRARSVRVELRDALTNELRATLPGADEPAVFSPDGTRVAIAWGGVWSLYDADSGTLRARQAEAATCLAFSPDGETIAEGGRGVVRFCGGRSLVERSRAGQPDSLAEITRLVFAPRGNALVALSTGDPTLWAAAPWHFQATLAGRRQPVPSEQLAAFSPDGHWLALVHGLEVWTWPTRDISPAPVVLKGHRLPVLDIAFSPDSQTLATASGNDVTLWNLETGEELTVLEGDATINQVDYLPDGTLVTANDGNLIRIYRLGP